jgi:Rad3-related DNA helicase
MMSAMKFDSSGNFIGASGVVKEKNSNFADKEWEDNSEENFSSDEKLKTSECLEFLKEDNLNKGVGNVFSKRFWNLMENDREISPLKFSNGKTQEDIVREIYDLVKAGEKVIFLRGACGTGKSAIALNLARVLGKASVVVPVKALQKQYEEDYLGKKYLLKNGIKLKMAVITGKDNHDSVINPGVSCADPSLPENIKISEKNYPKLLEFYKNNPLIDNPDSNIDVQDLKRISIAPANPYWSPILPGNFEMKIFSGVKKHRYEGCDGRDYIFYHRKRGCSYYDQFLAYMKADVILYNSAKYKSELSIGRKPKTEIDIIDEADEFLDSLFQQNDINLTRLSAALKNIFSSESSAQEDLTRIINLISLEEQNKRATGVDEDKVFSIDETKILDLLKIFATNQELESEIVLDELNYSNRVLEAAKHFKDVFDELYLTYRKDEEENLYVKLVSTNLKSAFNEIVDKSRAVVFMSGTLHSDKVLKHIFGIERYKVVEAETLSQGSLDIMKTGKEFDCKFANFKNGAHTRKDYLEALDLAIEKSILPTLVHVNSFSDLPKEEERDEFVLDYVMSSEKLRAIQKEDKVGRAVSIFKSGLSDVLFTTKCARGADFPGDICKSMVFTRYPNPNISDTFWKILKETHPDYFWEFYKDKAWREFMQRIFRGLRSKTDHITVLSPDTRILDSVRKLQVGELS